MALQAAFEDPRFSPVTLQEAARAGDRDLRPDPDEAGLRPRATSSSDGTASSSRRGDDRRSSSPRSPRNRDGERDEMLDNLSRRRDSPADAWREGARFSTFQALVFGEADTK